MSGWCWSASANSATLLTNCMAGTKDRRLKRFWMALPTRSHPGRDLSRSRISASLNVMILLLVVPDGEEAQQTSWPPPPAVSLDSNVLLILLVPFQLFAAIFRKSHG